MQLGNSARECDKYLRYTQKLRIPTGVTHLTLSTQYHRKFRNNGIPQYSFQPLKINHLSTSNAENSSNLQSKI